MGSAQILILIQSFLTFSRSQGLHFFPFSPIIRGWKTKEKSLYDAKTVNKRIVRSPACLIWPPLFTDP